MKLPASDKISTFGKRPYIKKGYYPAKLIEVKPFTDADGKMREGKFGRQLIFNFAIFKADPDTGNAIEPMRFQPDDKSSDTLPVVVAKFVYHEYKNRKTNEFQTAITPNSAITKILKSLGWTFSAEGVELDELIGKWAEVNIDDYNYSFGDEKVTASTIKDINIYKGTIPDKIEGESKIKEEKPVEKSEKSDTSTPVNSDNKAEITKLEAKLVELKELNKNGHLTDDGLKQATEQVETQIAELKK